MFPPISPGAFIVARDGINMSHAHVDTVAGISVIVLLLLFAAGPLLRAYRNKY